MPLPNLNDVIIIRDLRLESTVGPDRWGKVRPQPVIISITVEASLVDAGKTDDVADSVHYGNLTKDVVKATQDATFPDLFALAESIAHLTLKLDDRVLAATIRADALNQFLQAESLGVEIRRTRSDADTYNLCLIQNLRTTIIIGVNPPEREAKQTVLLNLQFHDFDWSKLTSWQKIHADLLKVKFSAVSETCNLIICAKAIESTEYLTLEAFVVEVARVACLVDAVDRVTVRAQKPSALTTAHSSGVEITRNRAFFNLPPT